MHMTRKSRTAILVTAAAALMPAGVAYANTSSSTKVQSVDVVSNAEESHVVSCFQIARPATATGTATVSFAAIAPTAAGDVSPAQFTQTALTQVYDLSRYLHGTASATRWHLAVTVKDASGSKTKNFWVSDFATSCLGGVGGGSGTTTNH